MSRLVLSLVVLSLFNAASFSSEDMVVPINELQLRAWGSEGKRIVASLEREDAYSSLKKVSVQIEGQDILVPEAALQKLPNLVLQNAFLLIGDSMRTQETYLSLVLPQCPNLKCIRYKFIFIGKKGTDSFLFSQLVKEEDIDEGKVINRKWDVLYKVAP